jgi:hypothetical protein
MTVELRTQKEQPLLVWDTHKIIRARAEYLLGEYPEDYPDLDAAFAMACEEPDTVESEWEGFTEYLTEILEERNPNGHWYVEMCNFGWRGTNGYKLMSVDDGAGFLSQVLPDTDCTFYIYADGDDGLKINNFHHDSPVGKEWHYATPATMCDHCGELMGQEAGITTPDGTFCEDCAQYYKEENDV